MKLLFSELGVSFRAKPWFFCEQLAGRRAKPRGACSSHCPAAGTSFTRANSTKNPSPRQNPTERPTDPARCGKGGSKGGIKEEPNAQALCRKHLDFFPDDR